jgi:hypothetical protein
MGLVLGIWEMENGDKKFWSGYLKGRDHLEDAGMPVFGCCYGVLSYKASHALRQFWNLLCAPSEFLSFLINPPSSLVAADI